MVLCEVLKKSRQALWAAIVPSHNLFLLHFRHTKFHRPKNDDGGAERQVGERRTHTGSEDMVFGVEVVKWEVMWSSLRCGDEEDVVAEGREEGEGCWEGVGCMRARRKQPADVVGQGRRGLRAGGLRRIAVSRRSKQLPNGMPSRRPGQAAGWCFWSGERWYPGPILHDNRTTECWWTACLEMRARFSVAAAAAIGI